MAGGGSFSLSVAEHPQMGNGAVCTTLRRCPILRLLVNRGLGHLQSSAQTQKGWGHPSGVRSKREETEKVRKRKVREGAEMTLTYAELNIFTESRIMVHTLKD